MKGCFLFFHAWTQWHVIERGYDGYHRPTMVQVRECERCGFTQQRVSQSLVAAGHYPHPARKERV